MGLEILICVVFFQEKETLESKIRILERELSELKDKLQVVSRGLNNAATNISSQETAIDTLKSNFFEIFEKKFAKFRFFLNKLKENWLGN